MKKKLTIYKGKRSDEWGTPDWIFNPLNEQYKFTVDLAASKKNAKCKKYYSKEKSLFDNGKISSREVYWLNPPFSLAKQFFYIVNLFSFNIRCVAIYKATNLETHTWQKVILNGASWVCFVTPRVNYVVNGKETKEVPFGSALIGWNVPPPKHDFGKVIVLREA